MTTTLKQDNVVASNVIQISVQKNDFLNAITTVFGAISSKSTIPILNNILIQTDGPDQILLTGTDLELSIKTQCPATVVLQGSITVPAKKLYEIIRELAPGEIEITVSKNNAVNIKTNKSFFKIMGLEAEDFPKLPNSIPEQTFELDQQVLKQCLTLTSFAVSHDETRYTLNGVLVILGNQTARFIATDGKRLASVEKDLTPSRDATLEAIIPIKTVSELVKILSGGEGKVKIVYAQNQIILQLNKTVFVSRLIEGRFPNYEQVIPKEEKTCARVSRQELLSAMKRVSLLTSQENQSVKLDFTKGRILISSRSPNLGEAKEEVPAEVSGGGLTIGFNPSYVIDVLKNLESEEISLSMTDPDKPGLIRSEGGYLYVVMPMQLS